MLETETSFRTAERLFKQRKHSASYLEQFVINLEDGRKASRLGTESVLLELQSNLSKTLGAPESDRSNECALYRLSNRPGVLVYKRALTPTAQANLVRHILADCTQLPNLSNLDTHYLIPEESLKYNGLWSMHEQESLDSKIIPLRKELSNHLAKNDDSGGAQATVALLQVDRQFSQCVASCVCDDCEKGKVAGRKTLDARYTKPDVTFSQSAYSITYPSDEVSAYDSCGQTTTTVSIDPPICSTHSMRPLTVSQLVDKWRWITLGYQYHWASKLYHAKNKFPFSTKISQLTKLVAQNVASMGLGPEEYEPEAGIINFYGSKDSLMAHVDQSEPALTKQPNNPPVLISVSLGLAAIFLVGGMNRNDVPEPILLESGDVVVLSGEARRAFHGVPRVFEGTCPQLLADSHMLTLKQRQFIARKRINLNVRQVF